MHHRFYAPDLVIGADAVELPADEGRHLSRVLRLHAGDEVRVFDGRGREYAARVAHIDGARVVVAIGAELPDEGTEPKVPIVLAQALLKGDGMDQVVRDAVMLGVSRVVPLETARAEVPARRVSASGRVSRWQRIAVASVKQCGRAVVPEVAEPRRLEVCLREYEAARCFLLAEPALDGGLDMTAADGRAGDGVARRVEIPVPSPPSHGVLLIVGPEGGWTAGEVAAATRAGCRLLTLGRRTLRADAAAAVGLTALQCFLGDFSSTPGPRSPTPDPCPESSLGAGRSSIR
jgi:16S rRNA (uracil1498-N3)-methyltransferase